MSGKPDFDVGDVVVCVDDSVNPHNQTSNRPVLGQVYRVANVMFLPSDSAFWSGGWGVELVGVKAPPPAHGFAARRFRKIDAADEAFTRQMRAIKPVSVPA